MIRYQGLQTLEVLEGADRYNKWIAEMIMPYVKGPALEVGSGTGNISQHFLATAPLYVTDSDEGLVNMLREKFKNENSVAVSKLDIKKSPPKAMQSFFSTVFAVNVLEHIADDAGALKNMNGLLKKNGRLVLLVPAKKKAYTKLDKVLGHYRRYEKSELAEKLRASGYEVEQIQFFNVVGLLSWVIRDKFERKNFHLKPYQITAFDRVVPLLKVLERIVRVPVGISLIAVAKKV